MKLRRQARTTRRDGKFTFQAGDTGVLEASYRGARGLASVESYRGVRLPLVTPIAFSRPDRTCGIAEGGVAKPVTRDASTDWDPFWAPDGRGLYFVSDRGGSPASRATAATCARSAAPSAAPCCSAAGLGFRIIPPACR